MSEKFFPFDSVSGDRRYYASDFAAYFADVINSGISNNGGQLQISHGEGMQINISPGIAWLEGHIYENTTIKTLTLSVGSNYPRIDRIVCRLNIPERLVSATVIEGTPATAPAAPAIVRDGDFYDIGLATVLIRSNSITILENDITDTRGDPTVCGSVTIIGKENVSNKVTTITADSTNTQYASAKAVYDLVESVVGIGAGSNGKTLQSKTITLTSSDGNYLGDINGDGKIDNLDIIAMDRYISGITSTISDAADINGDGKIDSDDSAVLSAFKTSGLDNSKYAIARITEAYTDGTSYTYCAYVDKTNLNTLGSANTTGLSSTASALLLTILKDCYTGSNQDANIKALEAELLNSSDGSSSSGDLPGGGTETGGDDSGGGTTEVTVTGISAIVNQESAVVGTDAADLDITVTATCSDGTTAVVTDYSISGTVAAGENTFIIVYSGKTTTITVTGTTLVYSLYNRDMNEGAVDFGVEMHECKSFTVKLDMTPNEVFNNFNLFAWSYASSQNPYQIWFSTQLRGGNNSANTMLKADINNYAMAANNGFPTVAGERYRWVATYDADTDSCALYVSKIAEDGTVTQKSFTGTIDKSLFVFSETDTYQDSHYINEGNYTLHACEISFEHTSTEDAMAWVEREV